MRLTKIKLAGFKSFVDPTQITFPSNLTGVVGPNGCGKSNVIDAVRWVMGELSAKTLRGDNMTDVVFNGSAARKPVGNASVELIFDNSDGKIGGAYAGFNEVSLRRQVGRDGTSAYLINGTRCRRKDITNLFLGTGLGSRSYAIIEQGMISRVIDAKADDMRAFVEEAAGISRYKERRKETDARVAETRENLERLQDVRDEVEKQIRHLQRQAASARRYQGMKEEERRLTAQLLALKLRDLDSGAEVHDAAVRERETAMQAELAAQRAAEAAIERQRVVQGACNEALAAVQGRYYEVGGSISRLEQSIEHTRQLRERQGADLLQARAAVTDLDAHIARDEAQLAGLRAQLAQLDPEHSAARAAEAAAAAELAAREHALHEWQQQWELHTRAVGAADQSAQVERARIEQLENQLRRLAAQDERLQAEHQSLSAADSAAQLGRHVQEEAEARRASDAAASALTAAQGEVQRLRGAQVAAEEALEAARAAREQARGQLTALEALQAAALSGHAGPASEWLKASELSEHARLAATLDVDAGWERAVETALGDYLEAVCVENLAHGAGILAGLQGGSLTLIEAHATAAGSDAATLAHHVRGPRAVLAQLERILTATSLEAALHERGSLADGQSLITAQGEWLGPGWLRVSRGADAHAGVLEREQQLKELRSAAAGAAERVSAADSTLQGLRSGLAAQEAERERAQQRQQSAQQSHADRLGALQAARAQAESASRRGQILERDSGELQRERSDTAQALARANEHLHKALELRQGLAAQEQHLTGARDACREALAAARNAAGAALERARDLHVQVESRRSSESTLAVGVARMREQRTQQATRQAELEKELGSGDQPVLALQQRLNEALGQRLAIESELAAARRALEEADALLRAHDEQRQGAEQRVTSARALMDEARLAAQETHVRRAALAEQFAETGRELAAVLAELSSEAAVPQWDSSLAQVRADIEKLGPVNLAAIEELKDHTQRKEYLDSQFADLTAALETLAEAMRRIDKETRTRFEDTFERINGGLREKFPRLFGGGHAYLELVGEDKLTAGVAVMARPPGKKNSTIHLLSGGEKALTAVALVFSIFDLNPAPFCLLDEVDAPLDEHNVGRFCDIVREMSARVQFVFITHNKSTMELAAQLVGVTMNEPGVSRLVTVDVDEAVRLAAV